VLQGLRRLEALALNFDFSPEAVAQLGPLGPHLTMLSYAGDMTKTRSTRWVGKSMVHEQSCRTLGPVFTWCVV
jgi:hypothetical protein